MRRFAIPAVILFVIAAAASASRSAVKYQIQDLGTLPGMSYSEAYDINDAGQVVGMALRGFLWSAHTGAVHIRDLSSDSWNDCRGVNNRGDIVGCWGNGWENTQHGFLLSKTKGLIDLGVFEAGWKTVADKINERGQIVGYAYTKNRPFSCAVFWDSDGRMINIGESLGLLASYAYGLNNSGQVVGYYWMPGENGHTVAYRWSLKDGAVLLPPLEEGQNCQAFAINDAGQVAGEASIQGTNRPVVWDRDGSIRRLGMLPGHIGIWVSDINNRGQVAGVLWVDDYTPCATLWDTDGSVVKLDNIPGGTWSIAKAINNKGEIAGYARAGDDYFHAVIWTPAAACK